MPIKNQYQHGIIAETHEDYEHYDIILIRDMDDEEFETNYELIAHSVDPFARVIGLFDVNQKMVIDLLTYIKPEDRKRIISLKINKDILTIKRESR